MAFVRSFDDFAPPARFDSVPWTRVVVQESDLSVGPWATIETIVLEPVDADPSVPATREFTTDDAELDPAWYRLIWEDDEDNQFFSDPIHFGTFDGFVTPDDVAQVLGRPAFSDEELPDVEDDILAAISWAKRWLRNPFLGESGEQTYTFHHVSGTIDLPGVSPTQVDVYNVSDSDPRTLGTGRWYYDGRALQIEDRQGDLGLPEYEQNLNDRFWTRVVVTADIAADVDPMIKKGVAMAAAAIGSRQESAGRGIKSENLGDYSYQLAQAAEAAGSDPFFVEAKAVLRPFRRRLALVVP